MKKKLTTYYLFMHTAGHDMVSIGMPVYNGEATIRYALNSLLQQTFTNFELIISDNASNDGTESICREFEQRDNRIRYIRQQVNKGVECNFNYVFLAAAHRQFMWAACDDWWNPLFLQNALQLKHQAQVQYIFPTFDLESRTLPLKQSISRDIFTFLESKNRQSRTIKFINLHHHSHKCNLVYSLFNKELLEVALKKASICNDGVLSALIASLAPGAILEETLFKKRYKWLWPGFVGRIGGIVRSPNAKAFLEAKDAAHTQLLSLFPEYSESIASIFRCYKANNHAENYMILPLNDAA